MFDFESHVELDADGFNEVPDDFKGAYQPIKEMVADDEGNESEVIKGYKLDVDNGLVKALMGSSKALSKARAEAKAAKSKQVDLSSLKDYGDTPEAILETLNAKIDEARANGNKKLEDQIKAVKADLTTSHQRSLEEVTSRAKTLESKLVQTQISNDLKDAILEDSTILSPPIIKTVLSSELGHSIGEGMEITTFVKDAKGEPRYSQVTGQPMTVKERIAEMKKDPAYAALFKAPDRSGAGTNPDQRGSPPPAPKPKEKTALEKIQAGLESR